MRRTPVQHVIGWLTVLVPGAVGIYGLVWRHHGMGNIFAICLFLCAATCNLYINIRVSRACRRPPYKMSWGTYEYEITYYDADGNPVKQQP